MKRQKTNHRSKPENQERKRKTTSEKKYPGYPYYPAKEDATTKGNMEKEDADMDELSNEKDIRKRNEKSAGKEMDEIMEKPNMEETTRKRPRKSHSDLTDEDLSMLGDKEEDMDLGEDEEMKRERVWPVDMGSDLDVPGSDEDDSEEDIGEEDEENNYYSLDDQD